MANERGRSGLAGLAVLLLLAVSSAPALAVDSLELFDPGVSDFEFYLSLSGVGQDESAVGAETVLGIGITDCLSGQIFASGEANQYLEGAAAEFGFGIFGTPVDTDHLDLDTGLNVATGGGAHGDFALAPFIEINLDSDPEMLGYGAYLVVEEALSGSGATIMPVTALTLGAYYTVKDGHQFLAAFDVTFNHRNADERNTDVGSIALGYNSALTDNIELITEVSFDIPQDDDDFGAGFVIGFIAALP